MKTMLSLLTLLTASSMALTSCLGDSVAEEKGTVNYGGSSCLNYVTDLQTNESFVSTTPPSYKIEFNYTKGLATVEMANVQLAQNFSALSFQLPEMTAQADYYFTKIAGTDITPVNVTSQYVFNDFLLRYSNRIWDGNFWPVYQISYTINNRYQVKVIPASMLLFGTTVATLQPTEDTVTSEAERTYTYKGGEQNIYNFLLVANSIEEAASSGVSHTLSMKIQSAVFSNDMLPLDIIVEKLPVAFDAQGYRSVTEEGVAIKLKNSTGADIDGVTISNYKFDASLTAASELVFDITFDNYRNLTGTYHVSATIDNYIIDETTNN